MQNTNHGKSFKHICTMWSLFEGIGQIFTSIMKDLMLTIFPVKTIRCIEYLSFVGYLSWRTILSIISGELDPAESFHPL